MNTHFISLDAALEENVYFNFISRIKSIIQYVSLFRKNNLVLTKEKQSRAVDNHSSHTADNHRKGNEMLNSDNEDDDETNSENGCGYSFDQNSVVRVFSWSGNKDLNVSLLPDLPLIPRTKLEQNVNGMYVYLHSYFKTAMCILTFIYSSVQLILLCTHILFYIHLFIFLFKNHFSFFVSLPIHFHTFCT